MTILKCSATKCMYNENELCSRGDIEITGAGARNADETNCGSFRERNASGAAMNSEAHHCGCEKINIDCKAQECTYNEHCKCTASAIVQKDAMRQNAVPSPVNADFSSLNCPHS